MNQYAFFGHDIGSSFCLKSVFFWGKFDDIELLRFCKKKACKTVGVGFGGYILGLGFRETLQSDINCRVEMTSQLFITLIVAAVVVCALGRCNAASAEAFNTVGHF